MFRIPNRAKSLTVISSAPLNENWESIESSVNVALDVSKQLNEKVNISELGEINGVATLDDSKKLSQEQLPKNAVGHVYSVESLEEQLNLEAYSGDICVREDLGKTYALANGSPSNIDNWIEIASVLGGGDTFGNPAFTSDIKDIDWQIGGNGFYITFMELAHNLGATKNLIVNVKNEYYENVICNYTVEEDGTVTIFSDAPFSGSVIISDLRGNCKNLVYNNYCINHGASENNEPAILTYTYDTVYLSTRVPIILVDGLGALHRITISKSDALPNMTGKAIIFIDSEDITSGILNKLSFLPATNYLGILDKLPTEGTEGQRCYVKFDGSYEYNGGWKHKAFTPIGELFANSGVISDIQTYPFNENGINLTRNTKAFNHLYGPQINGFAIKVRDNILTVQSGTCLMENDIIFTETISKDCTALWNRGNNSGCLSPYDTDLAGWANIYLIYNGLNSDIMVSTEYTPTLPENYTSYRLIGALYIKEDSNVINEAQYDDYVYLAEPIEHIFEIQSDLTRSSHGSGENAGGGIIEEDENIPNDDENIEEGNEDLTVDALSVPNNVNIVKIYYELLTETQPITFSTWEIPLTHLTTNNMGVIELPTDMGNLAVNGNIPGKILIKLIAFKKII